MQNIPIKENDNKCPFCGSKTIRGYLSPLRGLSWKSEEENKGIVGFMNKPLDSNISANKCTKCSKLILIVI